MSIAARSFRVLLTLVVFAAALAGGWYVWRAYADTPWTRDGRVRANVIQVTPDVSGAATDLNVQDNQTVKKGDVLFVIDQARYKLALDQAEATVDGRFGELQQRRKEAERRDKLTSAAVADEAREQARTAVVTAEAAWRQAIVERDVAKLNFDRTVVRSPVNGYVTNLLLNEGDYATAGKAAVAVVDSDSFYVAGYFEETKLRAIREGDPATARLMGHDGDLTGHVESVARAIVDRDNVTSADLIANVNPSFTWVRLAQRIPVRIRLDPLPAGVTLAAGMTATVVVHPKAR
ncbi:RND family efflux transporter MFP subunit [Methylopila capsulata]|uniref:Antibiotic resistance protein n=1 Tax=Methylopila capsulata TaxID=61654 RepID=A0A9W6MT35_9HYPH|nr:efflux RND transporter periplasmic adaptor subunit [Methylopila capsulata]MBM7852758.1 RND family efflux transporter MFP subunit [Methylopila capsulata]GLK56968.1 antibiotic resistance protein [Methylopila capsulata]